MLGENSLPLVLTPLLMRCSAAKRIEAAVQQGLEQLRAQLQEMEQAERERLDKALRRLGGLLPCLYLVLDGFGAGGREVGGGGSGRDFRAAAAASGAGRSSRRLSAWARRARPPSHARLPARP